MISDEEIVCSSFQSNHAACCLQILLQFFGLFFLHVFLEHGWSLIGQILGLLKA